MKKALVLLLVLAIAGGVAFAQAPDFTITGEVRATTSFDLGGSGDEVTAMFSDDTYGLIGFGWDLNGYNVGLNFKVNPWGYTFDSAWATTISMVGSYLGDTWGFKAEIPILKSDALAGAVHGVTPGDGVPLIPLWGVEVSTLWGYWYLFNEMVLLEVAFDNGRANGLWAVSSLVGGNVANDVMDEGAGILINFEGVHGLNVGIVFDDKVWNTWDANSGEDKIVNLFKTMGLGGNYDLGFMAFSLEGRLVYPAGYSITPNPDDVDAEVFLGTAFDFGALSVGADLGLYGLGKFGNYGRVDFGVGAEFASGPLTVGLNLRIRDIMDNRKAYVAYAYGGDIYDDFFGGRMVTADPYVSFQISENLFAKAGVGFYIGLGGEDRYAFSTKNEIGIAFNPLLAYHFLGGEGDGVTNGIVFEYKLGYDIGYAQEIIDNWFKIGFRWSF